MYYIHINTKTNTATNTNSRDRFAATLGAKAFDKSTKHHIHFKHFKTIIGYLTSHMNGVQMNDCYIIIFCFMPLLRLSKFLKLITFLVLSYFEIQT